MKFGREYFWDRQEFVTTTVEKTFSFYIFFFLLFCLPKSTLDGIVEPFFRSLLMCLFSGGITSFIWRVWNNRQLK